MNQFFTLEEDPFLVGETNLSAFLNRPQRITGGFIFFCEQGTAVISTGVIRYDIVRSAKITLLPNTILTVHEISKDFKGQFIAFSDALFGEVNFRLQGPFFQFMKENPVYVLPDDKMELMMGAFRFISFVYHDKENQFRHSIIKSQLQCIFWETYDKTQRHFLRNKSKQKKQTTRNQELFQQFIALIRTHCTQEREVAFYADKLRITPRYLSSIARQITSSASAKEVIDRHIILEIKVLLQSTNLPIQEIAHRMNFPDQSYMGRYFKRHTGESPTEYRNKK